MKNFTLKNIGKTFFLLSFALGNICLFGYIFTQNLDFAIAGYFLLIFGTLANLIVILGLLIYAFFHKNQREICYKSVVIMLLNIPVAILYAIIGMSLI